ncbi:MAG: MFS transporter, partial [Burkholderiaceae bacterium]|nr:MFS transporter [Burkholderiaceae bacterium]
GPFRVTPDGWSFTQGMIMLGWLQAIYPFCMFIAAPILGQLSDRHGRRPVLALSIFGTAIGYVLFAIGISTGNLPLLFAARGLDGLTGG